VYCATIVSQVSTFGDDVPMENEYFLHKDELFCYERERVLCEKMKRVDWFLVESSKKAP
jgi:hypothetical protein